MVIVNEIKGDLLNSSSTYIAQQCNCVTVKSLGLSKTIADRYPYANVYSQRTKPSEPGTILICKSPVSESPNVICMFAQYCPGKSGDYSHYYKTPPAPDTKENRQLWFQQCLDLIVEQKIEYVSMPAKIGCGLAGGDWKIYKSLLEKSPLKITLYQNE